MSAVFLDRDGVINDLVLNPSTGEYEPPHTPESLLLCPYVVESLQSLQNAGFKLFLVSNQPDAAKGKTTLENLEAVHRHLDHLLKSNGISFDAYYYCYHHPKGIVQEYSFDCMCRKPKPYFLHIATERHNLDLMHSWMVGDRDTDIKCGNAAGTKTILIEEPLSAKYRVSCHPDYKTKNLNDAVNIILRDQIGCSWE